MHYLKFMQSDFENMSDYTNMCRAVLGNDMFHGFADPRRNHMECSARNGILDSRPRSRLWCHWNVVRMSWASRGKYCSALVIISEALWKIGRRRSENGIFLSCPITQVACSPCNRRLSCEFYQQEHFMTACNAAKTALSVMKGLFSGRGLRAKKTYSVDVEATKNELLSLYVV